MIDDPLIPPVGVLHRDAARTHFRVWAPAARRVELMLNAETGGSRHAMRPEPRGYFSVEVDRPSHRTRYGYVLDGEPPRPDPASRHQPEGTLALSAIWDPAEEAWDDPRWRGVLRERLVFYQMHVGTFTPEGTFDAAVKRLESLRDLGITAIQLMPVSQFAGSRGWGYDTVLPYAVQNTYGGPEAFRRFVGACHQIGLAVFVDVILNHFGPEGNVLPRFGPYFDERYQTDWGPAVNYDGPHCDPVRAYMLDLVRMWVRDYHVDGMRLDAADQIFDNSPRHILSEVAEVVHLEGDRLGRLTHVIAETDRNDAKTFLGTRERGGYSLDGQWNDDFHHAVHVTLTGSTDGYFLDYSPGPQALVKALDCVFVNNGNYSRFRDRRHGAPVEGVSAERFVTFVQNHDQIANGCGGRRQAARISPAQCRLAACLLLLAPRLPLIFQGQEYGETNDFPYFADFQDPQLVEAVRKGRAAEFAQFQDLGTPPDPMAAETRDSAVLSWSWSDDPERAGLRRLYQDLLTLRRDVAALRDFSAPFVRLRESEPILELRRGAHSSGAESIRVWFNLGDQPRPFPVPIEPRSILLRSEDARYAASSALYDSFLAPHECLVIGTVSPGQSPW